MLAIEELNDGARRIMIEDPKRFPTIEQARGEARRRNRTLAELVDREENERIFSPPKPPPAPERGAAFRQVDAEATKLMSMHPDKYRTREVARQRARELNPKLKLQEWRENQMTRPWNEKSKVQRHGERQEQETRDQLIDEESEAAIDGRARRKVDTAFISQHLDAIQRRVDAGVDTETAFEDEMRATLLPAIIKRIKGGKPKAASSRSIRVTPEATRVFTEHLLAGLSSGHDLIPATKSAFVAAAG